MPVNQTIQNFYRVAATKDFSRDFLFRVLDLKLDGMPALSEDQLVYAKTAKLPGRQIGNVAVPYMGLSLNAAGSVSYPGSDSYALKFFLDQNSELRNFFEEASRQLFNDTTSTGAYGTPDDNSYIILGQVNKQLNVISEYKLVGVQLKTIQDIEYQMSSGKGETVEIDVTLSYHFYEKTL
jgi:hypothetical protein